MLECAGISPPNATPASTALRMRIAPSVLATGCALWLAATSAHALGFGRIVNATQLGQPLNFSAVVRLDASESLARECVAAEVMVGENRLQPGQVRVTLEYGADGARSLRVTTSTLVDEPVVTVNASLGCQATVARQFVLFIDPPMVNLASSSAPAVLPQQRLDSQVAPLVAIVQTPPRARPVPRAATRPRLSPPSAPDEATGSGSAAHGAVDRPAPLPKRVRRVAAAPKAAPAGPRLQLEAAPRIAAAAPAAASAADSGTATAVAAGATTASGVAAAAPASSAEPQPAPDQLALERQRIQLLEDGLARLRADSKVTQQALVTLQARLREAESQRYANPLVYALAGLSALLALAVVGLWWRQSHGRGAPQWWLASPGGAGSDSTQARGRPPPDSGAVPLAHAPVSVDGASAAQDPELDEPLTARTAVQPRQAPIAVAARAAEPTRELSIEELIDLEQQAEFFVVLGQDEAAIDLLMGHVRNDGGSSPLPYLKLLEIYKRRGELDAYERIRERFNRRFNAYAPEWDADLQQGRMLADYPEVMQQLEQLWAQPEPTMQALDALLFRRNQTDATFELPAYRELLFLYSVARDRAEHGAAGPDGHVDLLLPLGEGTSAMPISHPMEVTRTEFAGAHLATQPLDLDVSYSPASPSTHAEETTPAALRHASGFQFTDDSGFLDLDAPTDKPPAPRRR